VNTTKYKQYAINIKQQLQINTHSNRKTYKVHNLYHNCIVYSRIIGLDLLSTRIDQSIDQLINLL